MPANILKPPAPAWHPSQHVSEPAPGVFFVEGPASNWIIVRSGGDFMIIDSGYPGDTPRVLESIEHLGLKPADAKAMLITHGHIDHTGAAAHFSNAYGTPVLCSPDELAHVQGREKHQVKAWKVIIRAWRPRVLRWMIHAIRAGSLSAVPASNAQAWTPELLRELPGRPEAILVPGHTPGNASILLPEADAIATGDSFVTGHPWSRDTCPQLLHHIYHSEPASVLGATRALRDINASVILPGHGPALAIPLNDALASLRS